MWHIYGLSKSHMWHICGTYVGHMCDICGAYVAHMWDIYGAHMWHICGRYVEDMWDICGTDVESMWHTWGIVFGTYGMVVIRGLKNEFLVGILNLGGTRAGDARQNRGSLGESYVWESLKVPIQPYKLKLLRS